MFILYTFLHVDMSCYLEGHVMIGLASQYIPYTLLSIVFDEGEMVTVFRWCCLT